MSIDDKLKSGNESELEAKVNKHTFLHLGAAAGASAFAYAIAGINAPLTGIAFGAGRYLLKVFKKTKTTLNDFLDEITVGSLVGIVGSKLFEYAARLIPNPDIIGKLCRVAYVITIGNPIFTGTYLFTDYAVKNKLDIAGAAKHTSENLWPLIKRTTLWLGIPLGLTINGYMGGYPGIVAADTAYRVIAEPQQKQSSPSYQPAYKPTQA